MKPRSFLTACAFAPCLFLIACGPTEKEDSVEIAQDKNIENFGTRDGEMDANFVVTIVEESYAEIKLAQLAMSKSTNPELKNIANTVENDYSKVLNELKDFSYKKGIAIPVEESTSIKNDIQKLQKEDRNEFDRQWIKTTKNQHESMIKKFELTLKKTQDEELKSWIINALPDLRSHLDRLSVLLE
jgi:putative membrane protein